jgi:hypothetical protein
MRRPVIATSLSAIAIFTAGVVAGQLGGLPLSFAASKPGVGATAGFAPGGNGSLTTYRSALDRTGSEKSMKAGAQAVSGGSLRSGKSTPAATAMMVGRDPRVVPGGPRGPTVGSR